MISSNMRDRLYGLLSDVLGVSRVEISDESSPQNMNEWDSFNHLLVVAAIENEFDVRISIEETISLRSVAIICDYLDWRGIGH